MPTYADVLRDLAELLDSDFNRNIQYVSDRLRELYNDMNPKIMEKSLGGLEQEGRK